MHSAMTYRKSSGFWHNTQSTSIWFKILWLEKHLFGGYIWSVFIVQLWHWWLKLSWGEAEKWDLPRRLHLNSAGIEFKDFSFNSNASNNADLITQGCHLICLVEMCVHKVLDNYTWLSSKKSCSCFLKFQIFTLYSKKPDSLREGRNMTCGWLEGRHGPDHQLFYESKISLKKNIVSDLIRNRFIHGRNLTTNFFSDNYRLTMRADDHPHSIKVLFF